MGRYRITRHIQATPDQVFRAFTDPALVVDWMDASAVLDVRGTLDEPGTTFTLVIFGPHHFRSEVVRAHAPHLHETAGRGRFGTYRMTATLEPASSGTDLELTTEYTLPLGPIGRWLDRRFIDREPRTLANREVDRLVTLVSDPTITPRPKGASTAARAGG
jgi:carbon monoxide dehydrogenase subunit G